MSGVKDTLNPYPLTLFFCKQSPNTTNIPFLSNEADIPFLSNKADAISIISNTFR